MIERAGQPYTAYQTRSVQCRNAGLQDIREAVAHVDVELQSHGKCQVEENHNALHHGRNGIYKPTTRCVQKRPKRINRTNRGIIVGPEQTLATYEATRGDQKGARVSFPNVSRYNWLCDNEFTLAIRHRQTQQLPIEPAGKKGGSRNWSLLRVCVEGDVVHGIELEVWVVRREAVGEQMACQYEE